MVHVNLLDPLELDSLLSSGTANSLLNSPALDDNGPLTYSKVLQCSFKSSLLLLGPVVLSERTRQAAEEAAEQREEQTGPN